MHTQTRSQKKKPSMTMIGCGNMGGAMLRQWIENDTIESTHIIKPSPPSPELLKSGCVTQTQSLSDKKIETDIVILAVKPHILKETAEDIATALEPHTILISIAAGITLETLHTLFPKNNYIIRTMPNTPCAVGKGVCGSVASTACTQHHKTIAHDLLAACGMHYWLNSDVEIDMITALSGSGPAYLYYFIESLSKAAQEIGLPAEVAEKVARQMVIGAAALAETDKDLSASTLRENVTSKGGTTQAALEMIMDGRLDNVLKDAMRAAQRRAQELNQ